MKHYTEYQIKNAPNYYGVRGIKAMNNGCWSDMELIYKGAIFNEPSISDVLYNNAKEVYTELQNERPFISLPDLETFADNYIKENVKDYLNDCIYAGACEYDYKNESLPLYKRYRDKKPCATYCMSNFGGIEILDIINDWNDYVVTCYNFGERYCYRKNVIQNTSSGRLYFVKGNTRVYLDECIRHNYWLGDVINHYEEELPFSY